ncbi:MAG: tRNA preQ1(34) S-adenosylmethionine ribosyltransferase-isomerase QueA [Christensenellaceae bacterium]|nr:tRNA preQ1(34) S-adenosylmethionine ribosyltransferase-isomerase QueA [Christensenellaceae bacterium]
MNKSLFHYDLPNQLIAQLPATPRDSSRLLVFDRQSKERKDLVFKDILDLLVPGDLLVLNKTRVIPARLYATNSKGRTFEILLLRRISDTDWEALMKPARKASKHDIFTVTENLKFELLDTIDDGVRVIRFDYDGIFENVLDQVGTVPLPPYITQKLSDKQRYQTVYASVNGSSAAPTAGLHFTEDLLQGLKNKGVLTTEILLHVGLGTFRPVKADEISKHHMHSEYFEVSSQAALDINLAKRESRRVIAVGTTTTRTLESVADADGLIIPQKGNTDIFIYPPYTFKVVDALITNFHLPESTLLMLVSAFADRQSILELYADAVKAHYRFFSFGDAMFIT